MATSFSSANGVPLAISPMRNSALSDREKRSCRFRRDIAIERQFRTRDVRRTVVSNKLFSFPQNTDYQDCCGQERADLRLAKWDSVISLEARHAHRGRVPLGYNRSAVIVPRISLSV